MIGGLVIGDLVIGDLVIGDLVIGGLVIGDLVIGGLVIGGLIDALQSCAGKSAMRQLRSQAAYHSPVACPPRVVAPVRPSPVNRWPGSAGELGISPACRSAAPPVRREEQNMSDDKKIKGPKDQNHVNVNEDYEVEYWTGVFRCTAAELRQAVKDAGSTHKDKVRAAVEKNRKK